MLSDDELRSVLVLDSEIDNGIYTLSGLTVDTAYTLTVAAVSIAGQSDFVVVSNVTTHRTSVSVDVRLIVASAVVAFVLVILASIGLYTCGRYVQFT